MRVKAVIAYDGSAYFGFQKQKTTKKTVTSAIEIVLRSLKIENSIIGSGRTDAGVHATGQIIHFDVPEYWADLAKLKEHINRKLTDIYFKHIIQVSDDFHARFDAKERVYRYVFDTQKPSVFAHKYISYFSPFNAKLLQVALDTFVGSHDFDFFRKTGSDTRTSTREIVSARHVQRGEYHYIYFKANGFLRAQVRMMIHVAMMVAQKELSLKQLEEQLSCQTKHSTNLAPPEGLYLARILYT